MPYKLLCEVIFLLTSEERREGRYLRRRAARHARVVRRNKTIEEVFTFSNAYKGFQRSAKGVRWKPSTQTYRANAAHNVRIDQKRVLDGTWKSKGFIEFDLFDRGKKRHIRSVHISERVVQHTLCDELLTPALTPSLIYDNCGSLPGKGMDFALDRCSRLTREMVRKYGMDLYVMTFDFSGYFDNIDHGAAMRLIERYVMDPRCVELTRQLVDAFGPVGLGLGSQVSQNIATALPSPIDHMVKEGLGIRAYVRYMDDGILIHQSREHLLRCLDRLREECAHLGIKLNERKTGIRKLSHGFTFLKIKFSVTPTGKVVRRVGRKTITRGRRKLKKLFSLYRQGLVDLADIDATIASMEGHLKRGASYHARKNLRTLYNKLLWEALKCT